MEDKSIYSYWRVGLFMKMQTIDQCHCMALRRAARRISQSYDEALAPTGLRATQFAILAILHTAEASLSVNELAARLDLDRTTTGKNLGPLERDRIVAVAVSETDRRAHSIVLTAAGRKAFQAAYPLWLAVQQRFESANGKRRTRALRSELDLLRM